MQNFLFKLIACTFFVFCVHTSQAQPAPTPQMVGVIKLVKGVVRAESPQGQKTLQPGDAVTVSDVLVTPTDGAASFVLRDGSTLMVGPNSRLELRSFAFDSTTQEGNIVVSLLRGTLRMITGLIGKSRPEAVEIRTPTTVVGVLGTDFIVHAEGEASP